MNREVLLTLDRDQLKELFFKKKELHKEILDEREFVLGQTNLHVPGTKVGEYEEELETIEEEMEAILVILHKRERQREDDE